MVVKKPSQQVTVYLVQKLFEVNAAKEFGQLRKEIELIVIAMIAKVLSTAINICQLFAYIYI